MIAYFEMIGGASGNMLLGAFVDAGLDLDAVLTQLRTIPVSGWSVEQRRVIKRGIAATYIDFVIPGEDITRDDSHAHDHSNAHEHSGAHHHEGASTRTLGDVLAILDASALSDRAKATARRAYERLGYAEAHTHGASIESVHFHEVGQIDAILDVAAAAVALELLGIERVYCSAFPIGTGSIRMQHGRYPNPPPATAELLRGSPTISSDVRGEMVTPTGAAILTSIVEHPGVRPTFAASAIGYGAGRSDFEIPNVLRLSLGMATALQHISAAPVHPKDGAPLHANENALLHDEVAILEANIDDMSPQLFELALERVLAAGAYDVWLAPVTMKKMRPAVVVGAIAPVDSERAVATAMLRETTTLGVRVRTERRYTLHRHIDEVETKWGLVRVKTATVDGTERSTLEYDDVLRIARANGLPIARVVAELTETLAKQ